MRKSLCACVCVCVCVGGLDLLDSESAQRWISLGHYSTDTDKSVLTDMKRIIVKTFCALLALLGTDVLSVVTEGDLCLISHHSASPKSFYCVCK